MAKDMFPKDIVPTTVVAMAGLITTGFIIRKLKNQPPIKKYGVAALVTLLATSLIYENNPKFAVAYGAASLASIWNIRF